MLTILLTFVIVILSMFECWLNNSLIDIADLGSRMMIDYLSGCVPFYSFLRLDKGLLF